MQRTQRKRDIGSPCLSTIFGAKFSSFLAFHFVDNDVEMVQFIIRVIISGGNPKSIRVIFKTFKSTQS